MANFSQQFASASGIATLLARDKAGLRLAFRNDVCDEIVEQPLHTGAAGSRRTEQRFMP